MKIDANGITIAYDDHGDKDAPVILACHSLATNRTIWEEFVYELKDDYRIITPDARGHGESDAPEGAYNFRMLMEDVTGLMDMLDIPAAHYVGVSMGGFIGQYLGVFAPERVLSLTLSSTTSAIPQAAQDAFDQRIGQAQTDGMVSLASSTIDRWFPDSFQEANPETIQTVEQMIEATSVNGFAGWCEAIKTLDFTSQLYKIKAPVLLTVGDEDPGTQPDVSQIIFDEVAEAEMVVFPESSHQHPVQYPFEYCDIVRDFIDDCENPEKDIWDDES